MTRKTDDIGERAAENTTAVNPLTASVSHKDLRDTAFSLTRKVFTNPFKTFKYALKLLEEDWEILRGKSVRSPSPRDRRFQDQAWKENPFLKRSVQHWLAFSDHLNDWAGDLDVDELKKARAKFVAQMLADAAAPTNSFWGNPAAIKEAINSGGVSIAHGVKNAVSDLKTNRGLPNQVDKSAFRVGENLATSKGKIIWRSYLLELIHYKPTTQEVHEIPYLGIPPQINKFYLFDLSPEKSVIKFLVEQGVQCFWISWRNPSKRDHNFGMNDYIKDLSEAMQVVSEVTKCKKLNVGGACSGGITLATLASKLASEMDDRINSLTFKVCVLDPKKEDTEIGQLVTPETLESARRSSKRKGVLSGSDLARVFAWMRPNDLIWNYVVNNYLMGQKPPAFDILYWNSDTTNLPAALHSDFLDISLHEPFANPGEFEIAGHWADLTKVDCDTFIVAGLTDHITPWKACYRTIRLFGEGETEFILSSSGHIQALLNPPSNKKGKYFRNSDLPDSADAWKEGAEMHSGSWWLLWSDWLVKRSGQKKQAPTMLGSKKYPALYPAPGKYVFQ